MKYWVALCNPGQKQETARAQLKTLGVTVGEYNKKGQEFRDCEISEAAFEKLDPLWAHDFIWGHQDEGDTNRDD